MSMNTSYAPLDEQVLRMSKSSLMTYLMCPRQYWWRYIGMADVRIPANPAMIRGSGIHESIDFYYQNGEMEEETVWADDPAIAAFIQMEESRKEDTDLFSIIDSEKRLEAFYEFTDEDGKDYEVFLVGFADMLLTAPDGGVCLGEIKTGNFAASKLARTRKELAYYAFLLGLMGEDIPTHFAYVAPDSVDEKLFLTESNKRNKILWSGQSQGLMLIEKVTKRSLNLIEEKIQKAVKEIYDGEWPMKWNDYFCPEWCEFNLSCEEELNGLAEPPC